MRVLILLLLLPNLLFAQISAKVIGVSDGDTITVLLDGNTQKKLRLAEVDCPESGQAFGKNAKQFTSGEVFGKDITFIQTDIDRYERIIAKVFYGEDRKYLSEEIIMAGWGWWYYFYSQDEVLGELEQQARHEKKGLWADPNPIAPWEYRKLKK